jgi:signal transduction histidine kinase
MKPAAPIRAWRIPWRDGGAVAALVCLGLSTQFLFQRALYAEWSPQAIALAWLAQMRDLALTAGAIIAALAVAGRLPLRYRATRALAFGAVVLGAALAGETAAQWAAWGSVGRGDVAAIVERSLRWLPLALVAGALCRLHAGWRRAMAEARAAEIAGLELARGTAEAELKILQARIEPHFLFNTLATVRRLHEADASRGRAMLSSFIRYLRVALPHMRTPEVTLGREIDLVTAYLDIVKARMNERLAVALDVPDTMRDLAVPPLSVATLVENAVKHGVGAIAAGGSVTVSAHRDGETLVVSVADTGAGLAGTGGSGTGLANLRGRLHALYGGAASVVLSARPPQGAVAELRVPARRLRAAGGAAPAAFDPG